MCLISYVCIKNVDIRFSWHDEFLNYLPFLEKPFMNSLLCCITRVCVCVCVCVCNSLNNKRAIHELLRSSVNRNLFSHDILQWMYI